MALFFEKSEHWKDVRSQPGKPNYEKLHVRLGTFKEKSDWIVCPLELALAGFYYTGYDDVVQCFSCHEKLRKWEETDSALGEHYRFSSHCPFVREEMLKIVCLKKPTNIAVVTEMLNIPEKMVKENPQNDQEILAI